MQGAAATLPFASAVTSRLLTLTPDKSKWLKHQTPLAGDRPSSLGVDHWLDVTAEWRKGGTSPVLYQNRRRTSKRSCASYHKHSYVSKTLRDFLYDSLPYRSSNGFGFRHPRQSNCRENARGQVASLACVWGKGRGKAEPGCRSPSGPRTCYGVAQMSCRWDDR